MARVVAFRSLQGLWQAQIRQQSTGLASVSLQQIREYAKVPEYWGRDSPYHGGTEFLGTPKNHLELAAKRPLSPDVFEINSISPHYKFPPGALSSITNRVTGVMLSTYAGAAGALALTGHLPLVLDFVTSSPLLLYPAKAAVAFPLVYHYLGGLRHLYWDEARHGRQVDDISPLKVPKVTTSSNTILGLSAVASALLTLVSF